MEDIVVFVLLKNGLILTISTTVYEAEIRKSMLLISHNLKYSIFKG